MGSRPWQRHLPQPLNVHRLLSEQAPPPPVYLRLDGTLELRGVSPFPRENKSDYFLTLPIAPCGAGAGSWQLWLMPGKGCSTQRPVGRDLLVGEARLSLCRMGLEPRDPSRSKLVALPELGCGQHTQARETAAPRAPSGLLVGGFSSARREDWTSPLHLPPLWSHGCDPAPLCWELGPQGLATTAYQDPGHPYRAQLGGPFSQNSKVGRAPDPTGRRPASVGPREEGEAPRSLHGRTLAARSGPSQCHLLRTFICPESVASLQGREPGGTGMSSQEL